jgi:hypothetical protein
MGPRTYDHISVPPGGRRCGGYGADRGPTEQTATVVPRSRRSGYIYTSLLYYSKRGPNGTESLYHKWHRTCVQYKWTALMRCNATHIIEVYG